MDFMRAFIRKWHLVGKILDKAACRRNNENEKPVKTTIVNTCFILREILIKINNFNLLIMSNKAIHSKPDFILIVILFVASWLPVL